MAQKDLRADRGGSPTKTTQTTTTVNAMSDERGGIKYGGASWRCGGGGEGGPPGGLQEAEARVGERGSKLPNLASTRFFRGSPMMGQWDPHTPVMGQWGHYLRKQVATFFVLRQLTTPQLTTTQLTTTQLYTRSVHPSGTPLYYVAPSPIVAPPRLSKARAAAYRGRQLGDSSHAAWHLGYLPPHMHMRSSHALKARLQAPHPELVARVAQHARPQPAARYPHRFGT